MSQPTAKPITPLEEFIKVEATNRKLDPDKVREAYSNAILTAQRSPNWQTWSSEQFESFVRRITLANLNQIPVTEDIEIIVTGISQYSDHSRFQQPENKPPDTRITCEIKCLRIVGKSATPLRLIATDYMDTAVRQLQKITGLQPFRRYMVNLNHESRLDSKTGEKIDKFRIVSTTIFTELKDQYKAMDILIGLGYGPNATDPKKKFYSLTEVQNHPSNLAKFTDNVSKEEKIYSVSSDIRAVHCKLSKVIPRQNGKSVELELWDDQVVDGPMPSGQVMVGHFQCYCSPMVARYGIGSDVIVLGPVKVNDMKNMVDYKPIAICPASDEVVPYP
jgi:hypothetical protein